jgi:DNA-binding response OmpR family regulator
MRALCATQEPTVMDTVHAAITRNGDHVFEATEMADAIALAEREKPEIAFVDVMIDGGAGLALVHHLASSGGAVAVYALAPETNLELGSQAMALGAAGFVSSPPSGDALLNAMSAVRARRAALREKAALEAELAAVKRRNALMNRVVQLAQGGAHSEVAFAILEALAEVSESTGAALYAAFDPPQGECVRLAAIGGTQNLAATMPGDELLRQATARGALVVPIGIGERLFALGILEGTNPEREGDVQAIAGLAATVLAFVDAGEGRERDLASRDGRARVYSFGYFQDIAGREIDKAKRHGRRLAVAGILLDADSAKKQRTEIEQVVLNVVRDTDVLARFDEREFYLLLPETGALGAHACRRRLLVRAEGDRRAKPAASDRRGPISTRPGRGLGMSIGVAAYPHDGTSLERLLRAARTRAHDAARSAVHTLGLAPMNLGEIIDTLLARPMMGAGIGSPSPLDLVSNAMVALVAGACREAKRAGAASVLVTSRDAMGMASATRQVFELDTDEVTVNVADVRAAPRCDNAEAIVINAEHGTWVCCGRRDEDRFRGVHAADPLLADLVAARLAQASGARWP